MKIKSIFTSNGHCLAERVEIATGLTERLRGLLGRQTLPAGQAMLIERCNAIHTIGMRFAIDVVFLDRRNRVCAIRRNIRPGRWMVWGGFKAQRALESAVGGLHLESLVIGAPLTFSPA